MGKTYPSLITAVVIAACFAASAIADERHEGHMHHSFPKDVDAFHSVLAPLWHARPGKERSQNACAKANEMERLAKEIRSGDTTPLVGSVVGLKEKCQKDPAGVDAALFDVHEAFHRLAEPGMAR